MEAAHAPPRDGLSALSPRTPRKPVSVVEAATSPLARTPRSATPNLRRAISSATLIEALRDLVRKQPEALAHLRPLLSQPRRRAGRCLASLVALCAIAVAALVVRGAVAQDSASRVLQIRKDAQDSEPRLPPRPKPGAKIAVAIALSACGALAGLCQWHPLARMQLQRLGAALLEAAGSAGAAGGAQPQHVGRLARPFGHALRIGRALLPSSAVEWLLVAFNLVLFTRLYIFTRSGAFVAVIDSIQMLVTRTEFLRRFEAFREARMRLLPGFRRPTFCIPAPDVRAQVSSSVQHWLRKPASVLMQLRR